MKELRFLTKTLFYLGLITPYQLSRYKVSEDFIRQYKDQVDWHYISENRTLNEKFIREFHDKLKWIYVCRFQKLSEDLIIDFIHKIDWYGISNKQELSEDFIRKFKDKVSWLGISDCQKLSEEFIIEFQDYLDFDSLITNSYQYSEYIQRFIVEKLYNTENVDVEAYYKDMTNYMKNHFEKIRMLS